MEKITTPFSEEQVKALNAYQETGVFHPFTCGIDSRHRDLVATPDGWICPDCFYKQNWAHKFIVESLPCPDCGYAVSEGSDHAKACTYREKPDDRPHG